MAKAINSQGSTIGHDAGNSPHTYALLENVKSITGPQGTAALVDVSNLSSVAKEYIPGLPDSGQVQIVCQFVAGVVQLDMLRMFNANADAEAFEIKIPVTSARLTFYTFNFHAIVLKWDMAEAVDAAVVLNITLQTTGGVTYVAP